MLTLYDLYHGHLGTLNLDIQILATTHLSTLRITRVYNDLDLISVLI